MGAGPGWYLLNCTRKNADSTVTETSAVAFYKDIALSANDGHRPDILQFFDVGIADNFNIWEGGPQSIRLEDGTFLHWNIKGTPESNSTLPQRTFVGTATDETTKWLVFKGDGGLLFTGADGFEHHKIYFAIFGEPVEIASTSI